MTWGQHRRRATAQTGISGAPSSYGLAVPSSAGFAARAKGGEMIVLCSWSNLRARPPRALAALAGAAALLVLLGGLASSRADTPGTAPPEKGCAATGPATIGRAAGRERGCQ